MQRCLLYRGYDQTERIEGNFPGFFRSSADFFCTGGLPGFSNKILRRFLPLHNGRFSNVYRINLYCKIRIRICPCGSGSGRHFFMRIRADPDPKHWSQHYRSSPHLIAVLRIRNIFQGKLTSFTPPPSHLIFYPSLTPTSLTPHTFTLPLPHLAHS